VDEYDRLPDDYGSLVDEYDRLANNYGSLMDKYGPVSPPPLSPYVKLKYIEILLLLLKSY